MDSLAGSTLIGLEGFWMRVVLFFLAGGRSAEGMVVLGSIVEKFYLEYCTRCIYMPFYEISCFIGYLTYSKIISTKRGEITFVWLYQDSSLAIFFLPRSSQRDTMANGSSLSQATHGNARNLR